MKKIIKISVCIFSLMFSSVSFAEEINSLKLNEMGKKVMSDFYKFQASIFSCDEKKMNEVMVFPTINKPKPHKNPKVFFDGVRCEKKPENKTDQEFLSEYFAKIDPRIQTIDFGLRSFQDKEIAEELTKINFDDYFDIKPEDEIIYFYDKNAGLRFFAIRRNDKFVGTTMVN